MKTYKFELQFYLTFTLKYGSKEWGDLKILVNEFSEEQSKRGGEIFATGFSESTVSFSYQIVAESLEEALRIAVAKDYSKFHFREIDPVRAIVWLTDIPE